MTRLLPCALLLLARTALAACPAGSTGTICLPATPWAVVNQAFAKIDGAIAKLYGAGNTREIVVTDAPYGAIPDDTGEDTDAIIRAMAAAGARSIRFPAGTYLIRPATVAASYKIAFTIRSDLHLRGDDGAILKIVDGVSSNATPVKFAMFSTPTTGAFSHVTFDGLIFDGNGANNLYNNTASYPQAFIQVLPGGAARIDDVRISNCTFRNNAGTNNIITGPATANTLGTRWTIDNTLHLNNALDASDFTAVYGWADQVSVRASRFVQDTVPTVYNAVGNARTGIELHGSGSAAEQNYFLNYLTAIYVYGNSQTAQTTVRVADNLIEGAYLGGIRVGRDTAAIQAMSGIDILNNRVVLTTPVYSTAATFKHGIWMDAKYAVTDVTIAGNHVLAPATMLSVSDGIAVVPGGVASGGKFDRLRIVDNATEGTYYGVRVLVPASTDGLGTVEIARNSVKNPSNADTQTAPAGVFLRGLTAIDRALVDANRLADERGGSSEMDTAIQIVDTVTAAIRHNRILGAAAKFAFSGTTPNVDEWLWNDGIAFANLATLVTYGIENGQMFDYCSDCTVASPCAGSGTGALAKRLNGAWVCN